MIEVDVFVKERIEIPDRVLLVREVFRQCIDARLAFNAVIERCASKGWPHRRAPIQVASRVQQLTLKRLLVRLDYLSQHAPDDVAWSSYTSTALVHARVQDDWNADNEAALARSDAAYSALQAEIENLRAKADPPALEEPYRLAKRDPELIAAAWELDRQIRVLDERLSVNQETSTTVESQR